MIFTRQEKRPGKPGCWIGCALSVTLVLALGALWWHAAMEMPVASIPQPVMPATNAFDTLAEAFALVKHSNRIGAALPSSGSQSTSAPVSEAEKQSLVTENAAAIAKVREANRQTYMNPPVRSFGTLLPYYANDRALARLLALDAAQRERAGDLDGAARSGLDAMELGAQVPHGSPLIGGLVGVACKSIGRRTMWKVSMRLGAAGAWTALQRTQQIRAKDLSFAETMQEEKWTTQAALIEVLRDPEKLRQLFKGDDRPAPPFVNSPVLPGAFYLVYSKRRLFNGYTAYVDSVIQAAKKPYGAIIVARPSDAIVQTLCPVYDQALLKFTDDQTQTALLETTLALRVYRLRNGRYPARLEDLTPAILPSVPVDPFGRHNALRYITDTHGYTLYSVGPDGRNDNGTPIDTGDTHGSNPNARYFVKADSRGDIVAGKNIW
ncbi:MAG TPA: hypothetical protein VKT77_01100 [Chthonomonadaceae bacterium]|nr:hypothetical protein [Chthonomonadaceae bacterium]